MIDIIGGASITSKNATRMLTGLRSVACQGCSVTLENGREYIDFQGGLHGAIYGYRPAWWVEAIKDALDFTCANSIACIEERIAAEMLAGFYPDIESVRFMTNGSDPCAAAVKLARAVTGRDRLLVYGYHGTASAYCTPPEANVRPNLRNPDGEGYPLDMRRGTLEAEREAYVPLDWGETVYLRPATTEWEDYYVDNRLGEIAAVIVECPPVDGWEEDGGFKSTEWLRHLADFAHHIGALFVLDEVVTGFRYGPNGAAGYYGLSGLVDLYCFGKTMGNGYPVSALAGKRDVMQELANGVHFSSTFFGDPIGLAAAIATLRRLDDEPPWEYIYGLGETLKEAWNGTGVPWKLEGHPTRPVLEACAGAEDLNALRRRLFRRGFIVVDHPWYVSTAHTVDDVDALCDAVRGWE